MLNFVMLSVVQLSVVASKSDLPLEPNFEGKWTSFNLFTIWFSGKSYRKKNNVPT